MMSTDRNYERTTPLAPSGAIDADYVKDTDEWMSRCLRRVRALDSLLPKEDLEQTVRDLASLQRWRILKPEDAAEQLYSPVVPTTRRGDL